MTKKPQQEPLTPEVENGDALAAKPTEAPEQRGGLAAIRIKDGRIDLDSMQDLWSLARVYVAAGTVPESFRGNVARTFVALQTGAEVGMQPMQALRSTMILNGTPSLYGDAPMALVLASGTLEDFEVEPVGEPPGDGEYSDDFGYRFIARRKGVRSPATGVFTVRMAKRARLWGKSGPWSQYPDRMLMVRARAMVLRDLFGDILGGFAIAEEIMDVTTDEGEPVSATERMLADLEGRKLEAAKEGDEHAPT